MNAFTPVRGDRPTLKVKLLHADASAPKRGSEGAVGYDLKALIPTSDSWFIRPGDRVIVSTGVAVAIPVGHYGRIAPRSGLAAKQGVVVLAGVIDPDYRGELKIILLNTGKENLEIKHGDRIAQLILERCSVLLVEEVDDLDETVRGTGHFGSTGA